ncbi:MAG: response regulator [Candidatus Hydrogenedentes bacterium]|nr:response regulator [Candidatus Hydrogenedentota bacterium]
MAASVDPYSRLLSALTLVDGVIRDTSEAEEMLSGVLGEMLQIFNCDRAWLLYPCDPDAPTFRVPMERTRPGFPGALARGVDMPMSPVASMMREVLAADGPVPYDPESEYPMPEEPSDDFTVRAQLCIKLKPKNDHPWMLGIRHCREVHVYSHWEKETFRHIASRIADSLTTHLTLGKLRESERRFAELVEESPDGIVVLNDQGIVQTFSPATERITGLSAGDVIGKHYSTIQVLNEEAVLIIGSEITAVLAGSEPKVIPLKIIRASGEPAHVEVAFRLVKSLNESSEIHANVRDVTDRANAEREKQELEEQLRHAQRLESVGRLAGGVAHDFNNLLTVILGNASLLLQYGQIAESDREQLREISLAAERSSVLTQQLLAFSRKQILSPTVLSLNDVVGDIYKMLRRLLPENIILEAVLTEELALIRADRGQVEQILMNLCVNCRDAMPDGGVLTIETGNVELDEEYARAHTDVEPGPYVLLAVTDTGIGIEPEILSHVFEPFYTIKDTEDKDTEDGIGLELATVYGIVKQSGAHIWVYSEPGKGACFKVYFPQYVGEDLPSEAITKPSHLPTGTERILLVEDEAVVREVACRILEGLDYRVVQAANVREAREKMEREGTFDLVVTDVIMPGGSGTELAGELKARGFDTRILYISGYADQSVTLNGFLEKGNAFLQKPFTPTSLAEKVREVLDDPRRAKQ